MECSQDYWFLCSTEWRQKRRMKEKSGGKGKVFPSNFLYSGEIFPPQIPVTFTVGLKPLLVKALLLRNSMNDTNGRRFCTDHKCIQTDCFQVDVTKSTVFCLKRSSFYWLFADAGGRALYGVSSAAARLLGFASLSPDEGINIRLVCLLYVV